MQCSVSWDSSSTCRLHNIAQPNEGSLSKNVQLLNINSSSELGTFSTMGIVFVKNVIVKFKTLPLQTFSVVKLKMHCLANTRSSSQ